MEGVHDPVEGVHDPVEGVHDPVEDVRAVEGVDAVEGARSVFKISCLFFGPRPSKFEILIVRFLFTGLPT